MKNFEEYSGILNLPLSMEQDSPDSRTPKEKYNYVVESVGGLEEYKKLEESGIHYKELYESNILQYVERKANDPEFKEVFGGQIAQTVVTTLMRNFVQPWVEKEGGITKYSLIWYMLTYGVVEAIFKLVKQALDKEKQMDVCVVLASGVVEGFQAWASLKVIKSFLKILGFGKDSVEILDSSVSLNIITQHVRASLLNTLNDEFVENILCDWSKGSVMGDTFRSITDGLNDAKNYIMELID